MLHFYDADSGIHSQHLDADGATLMVQHQHSIRSPISTIPYSRTAAIVSATAMLRQFAPWMLANPDKPLTAETIAEPRVVEFRKFVPGSPVSPRFQ